jgi:hypothetical protein
MNSARVSPVSTTISVFSFWCRTHLSSQIRTEFGYDITFEVYDAKGRLLASRS